MYCIRTWLEGMSKHTSSTTLLDRPVCMFQHIHWYKSTAVVRIERTYLLVSKTLQMLFLIVGSLSVGQHPDILYRLIVMT